MRLFKIVLVLLLCNPVFAADKFINKDLDSGANDGTSEANAWRTDGATIQTAYDNANAGDIIWVKKATTAYLNDATIDIDITSNLHLKGYKTTIGDMDYSGAFYKDSTDGWVEIDGTNAAGAATFDAGAGSNESGLTFHNLKITNTGANVAVIRIQPVDGTSATQGGYVVNNCWITGGKQAVTVEKISSCLIFDSKFTGSYDRTANIHAVLRIGSNVAGVVIIDRCEIDVDLTPSLVRSTANLLGTTVITNSTFKVNTTFGTLGSALIRSAAGPIILKNCTFYTGAVTVPHGLVSTGTGNIYENNIIEGSALSDIVGSLSGTNIILDYNAYDGNAETNGINTTDVGFVDPANGDFSLKPSSPLINAGRRPILGSGRVTIGAWQPYAIANLSNRSRYQFEDIFN